MATAKGRFYKMVVRSAMTDGSKDTDSEVREATLRWFGCVVNLLV